MSQLNVTTLKHESAGVDNITLNASGYTFVNGLRVSGADKGNTIYQDSGDFVISSDGGNIGVRVNPTNAYFNVLTEGTERFRIDSAGRVTMPYQPAFSYINTSYTQATGSYSIIIPGTTKLNRGNHFNGATGVFTAPVDGFYTFGFFGLSYPHASDVNNLAYFVNGVNSSNGMQFGGNSTSHQIASGGYSVYLNASDTLDLRYYRNGGGAAAYSNQWTMWGYLVG